MRTNGDENTEGLTPATIQALLNVGVKQSGIARMFGVTRQAVHDMIMRYGLPRQTRQELLEEVWPWVVPDGMGNQSPYKLLRDHGEWVIAGPRGIDGRGLSEARRSRLRSFYQRLRDNDFVVEFDPNIPPEPGVQNRGGFAYRKRRKSDGDLLIRVNEYTDITEYGRRVWTFPDQEP